MITIIGILVGLAIPAVIYARVIAKQAAVTMELKQLEMACQAYKEKFGKYPPDFTNQSAVLRHLAKAFPRFVVAGADDTARWNNLQTGILASWGVDINTLSPASALTFWLGGKPDWRVRTDSTPILPGDPEYDPMAPVKGFLGFSENVANPFDGGSSRIKPFFEIALMQLNDIGNNGCFVYWPKNAMSNRSTGPIVYFRAENGNYTSNGLAALTDLSNVKNEGSGGVWPAIDIRLSTPTADPPVFTWINPQSFQIFSSGLDVTYSPPNPLGPLAFPTGENYDPVGQTFDDITNFSGGTLENAMP